VKWSALENDQRLVVAVTVVVVVVVVVVTVTVGRETTLSKARGCLFRQLW
jgi:hypothetical protein